MVAILNLQNVHINLKLELILLLVPKFTISFHLCELLEKKNGARNTFYKENDNITNLELSPHLHEC